MVLTVPKSLANHGSPSFPFTRSPLSSVYNNILVKTNTSKYSITRLQTAQDCWTAGLLDCWTISSPYTNILTRTRSLKFCLLIVLLVDRYVDLNLDAPVYNVSGLGPARGERRRVLLHMLMLTILTTVRTLTVH